MDWLTSIVGAGNAGIANLALWTLLALFILWVVFRMFGSSRKIISSNGRHRLEVIDATAIDNRRRLVLVRCDNREHLVLIGGMNDLVVDNDVNRQSGKDARHEVPSVSAPPVDLSAVEDRKQPPKPLPRQAPAHAPSPKIEIADDAPAQAPAQAPHQAPHQAPEQARVERPRPAPVVRPQPTPEPAITEPGLRRTTDRAWTSPEEPPVSGRRMTDIANIQKAAVPAAVATAAAVVAAPEISSRDEADEGADDAAFAGLVADRDQPDPSTATPSLEPVKPPQEDAVLVESPVSREPDLEEEIEAEMNRLINDLSRNPD